MAVPPPCCAGPCPAGFGHPRGGHRLLPISTPIVYTSGFAAAAIVLAAANPAANAALIGILGGIGGLEYFTMWPLMEDVVNTENTLMTELRHSRKHYGEGLIGNDLKKLREGVDKAMNACVLSKLQITVPPPKKPDIQKPPIP